MSTIGKAIIRKIQHCGLINLPARSKNKSGGKTNIRAGGFSPFFAVVSGDFPLFVCSRKVGKGKISERDFHAFSCAE